MSPSSAKNLKGQRRPKAADGLASPPLRTGDVLISEKTAAELLGGVSHMFFRRRCEHDPSFPKVVRVGRARRYWRADILTWLGSPAAGRSLSEQRVPETAA